MGMLGAISRVIRLPVMAAVIINFSIGTPFNLAQPGQAGIED
jgi:hypothetical protein